MPRRRLLPYARSSPPRRRPHRKTRLRVGSATSSCRFLFCGLSGVRGKHSTSQPNPAGPEQPPGSNKLPRSHSERLLLTRSCAPGLLHQAPATPMPVADPRSSAVYPLPPYRGVDANLRFSSHPALRRIPVPSSTYRSHLRHRPTRTRLRRLSTCSPFFRGMRTRMDTPTTPCRNPCPPAKEGARFLLIYRNRHLLPSQCHSSSARLISITLSLLHR